MDVTPIPSIDCLVDLQSASRSILAAMESFGRLDEFHRTASARPQPGDDTYRDVLIRQLRSSLANAERNLLSADAHIETHLRSFEPSDA